MMKLVCLTVATVVASIGCTVFSSATPTVSPELAELGMIESRVQTACDKFIREESDGQGLRAGELVVIEGEEGASGQGLADAVEGAYNDALRLLNRTNAESPHSAQVRDTVGRIAALKGHMDVFWSLFDELVDELVESPELDPEYWPPLEQWDTMAVELCVGW